MRRARYLLFCVIILLVSCPKPVQAQGEAANWFFGQQAGLHFNPDGSVSNLTSNAMPPSQSCATISDKNGNLLFYTNGETVWNRQHQVMTNGNGLLGFPDGSQTCIIIPHPGNPAHYYIFHLEGEPNKVIYNLRYSLVDLAAQNGLGEVMPAFKNTLLYGLPKGQYINMLSQKVAAVHHANNRDIWLIVHRPLPPSQYEFRSYKITADSGLINKPVISLLNNPYFTSGVKGCLKVSPNGRWLAGYFGAPGFMFQFNNQTGVVSQKNFGLTGQNYFQNTIEFSPDNSKLYLSDLGKSFYQYDLSSNDPITIVRSEKRIYPLHGELIHPDSLFGAMQLALNGRIYVARNQSRFLYEIAHPNSLDTACHFRHGPLLTPGLLTTTGLPNFIASYFAPPRFTFTSGCPGQPVIFTIPDLYQVDSVRWNFDDAGSGIANTSRQLQPNHVYTKAGNYAVRLTVFTQGEAPVFERQVIVKAAPEVSLGSEILRCKGAEVTLTNNASPKLPLEKYRWSTGDTTDFLTVRVGGLYWLEVQNANCTTRDSVTVTFKDCPPPFIPNIITLNGDGKNETFAPQYLPDGNWQLQVFNRWGNRIFESPNYQNDWPQSKVASGMYYYLLQQPGTRQTFKGWLEVVH